MKKFLAIVLVLSMAFSFVACKSKEKGEAEITTVPESFAEETTAVDTLVENETVLSDDVSTEDVSASVEESSVLAEEESSREDVTAVKELDLNDKQAVLDYYNAAVIRTRPNSPKGTYKMGFSSDVTGGGSVIGLIIKFMVPVAKIVLENHSSESDFVPGEGKLRLDDCKSISATKKNGVITVNIALKEQIDGPDGDPSNGGPAARGIGTLGSINYAAEQMGITFHSGRDTIRLTYKDATIKATIDEKTGGVTGGTWKYTVDLYVGAVRASFKSFTMNVEELRASFYYVVNI